MKSFSKRLFWLPLALVLCAALLLGSGLGSGFGSGIKPVDAAGLSDPRLARLEFEVSALQSQVNQLQNQLSRGTSSSVQTSPTASSSDRLGDRSSNLGDPTSDEQFDNLATLVIELNQRVLQIEDRLADSAP